MIVFAGKLSEECKKFTQKQYTNGFRLVWILTNILWSVLITIVALCWDRIIFLFFIVLIPFLILLYPFSCRMHSRIEIAEDYLSVDFYGEYSQVQDMMDVKQVLDMGDWYYITFYFPHKSRSFVCQKDLIIEGTIEEFEALFEDKLVRKENVNN